MIEINSVLGKFYEIKRPRSERASVVKMFVDKLIADRGDKKFYIKGEGKDIKRIPLKPIDAKLVGIRLAHFGTSDLYYIYSICKDARSFEKMFWFMTRTKVLA